MKRYLIGAMVGLLLPQHAIAEHFVAEEGRAAFRQAVDEYQIFVIPHCAPDEVRTYVTARAHRDRAFVRSLRKTDLEADYKQAVAARAERDSRTVYECMGPPPPPPPHTALPTPSPAQSEIQHHDRLAEDFAAGDRQFAAMVRLRNALIGSARR